MKTVTINVFEKGDIVRVKSTVRVGALGAYKAGDIGVVEAQDDTGEVELSTFQRFSQDDVETCYFVKASELELTEDQKRLPILFVKTMGHPIALGPKAVSAGCQKVSFEDAHKIADWIKANVPKTTPVKKKTKKKATRKK